MTGPTGAPTTASETADATALATEPTTTPEAADASARMSTPASTLATAPTTAAAPPRGGGRTVAIQHRVARVLTIGTGMGVALLAVGVAAMGAQGINPIPADGDLAATLPDPAALLTAAMQVRWEAFVWLGLVVLIATPAARVAAALIGFAAARDRAMVAVAAAILAVISAGVVVGGLGG